MPSMLVHDGILFELDCEEQVQQAIEIMRTAGTEVCGGLEIGVDIDQKLIGGARYQDKRPVAKRMWEEVMRVLREIGALPQRRGNKMWNKMTSYRFAGGSLVARTAEEHAELQRRKAGAVAPRIRRNRRSGSSCQTSAARQAVGAEVASLHVACS